MVKYVLNALLLGVSAWIIGLVIFYVNLPKPVAELPELQAYAVFTGGQGRVLYGLETLQKAAKPMLITGIHPETSLPDLLQQQDIAVDTLALLTLDHTAQTTRQNMQVLHHWARTHGFTDVGVITSHYHMPRVRLLAWWHAPQLNVVPLVVQYPTKPMFYLREYVKLWAVPILE